MARRASGEGSIYRRDSDGQYVASLSWLDPVTGRRRRATYYGRSRAEVGRKLATARRRVDEGLPVRDARITVGEWATTWLDTSLPASGRRPTTKQLYRNLVNHHVLGSRLSDRRLDQLRPSHIDQFVLELRSTTRMVRGEQVGLADSTVQKIVAVLRLVLDGAVRDGLIGRNPAAGVKPPAAARREARFLSTDEVNRLLAAAEGTRACPVGVHRHHRRA